MAGDDAAGTDPGDLLEAQSLCFSIQSGADGFIHVGGVDEVDVILCQVVLADEFLQQHGCLLVQLAAVLLAGDQSAVDDIEFGIFRLTDLGYEVIYPSGAFYMFVKALEEDDEHFSNVAKEHELLLVPSSSFGVKGYVRISYCVAADVIKNAMPAFEKLMKHYKGE